MRISMCLGRLRSDQRTEKRENRSAGTGTESRKLLKPWDGEVSWHTGNSQCGGGRDFKDPLCPFKEKGMAE